MKEKATFIFKEDVIRDTNSGMDKKNDISAEESRDGLSHDNSSSVTHNLHISSEEEMERRKARIIQCRIIYKHDVHNLESIKTEVQQGRLPEYCFMISQLYLYRDKIDALELVWEDDREIHVLPLSTIWLLAASF